MGNGRKALAVLACVAAMGIACGKGTTITPSRVVVLGGGTGSGTVTLTAPVPQSPADTAQLTTLRPTLTVGNTTSNTAGARTYEFAIADNSQFTATGDSHVFTVVFSRSGVAEGGNGTTSLALDQDLQPTTHFFWRARVTQGTTTSDWSETRSFNSKLVGFNRAGELYDPLIEDTIGTPGGSTTFLPGEGIRINDQNSFVRYQLAQTISNGEFSVDVKGLFPNGPGEKLKVFSMMDGGPDLFQSKYLLHVMYRGQNGNPPNCIAFKAVFGDNDFTNEPDINVRNQSVRTLDPSHIYHWKATWSSEFRLQVFDGGINGTSIYNFGVTSAGGSYSPNPHTAYLGANNGPFGEETGSWPGLTYRNLWVANHSRPASLGSALLPANVSRVR